MKTDEETGQTLPKNADKILKYLIFITALFFKKFTNLTLFKPF
jgi:hypothetical protein